MDDYVPDADGKEAKKTRMDKTTDGHPDGCTHHDEPSPDKPRRLSPKTLPWSPSFTVYGVRLLQACQLSLSFWLLMELLVPLVPNVPDMDFVEYFC